jgi:hypothetical protein
MDIRLPCGRPTGGWSSPPDLTGFPCFALVRYDRCRALPLPRDRGALLADFDTSAITAAFQRRVLFSSAASHRPEFLLTRLTGVHVIRPSGLPLACNRWMEHRSLNFLPGFTPRRYQRRMPGAGTSVEHSLGVNHRSFSTLHFGYLTHPVRPHVARQAQMIPGWPYSFVAALEPGRTSWTALLDVVRVHPSDDHTDLAATQLRTVIQALITAGHWHEGDPEIWIIGDSGYDGPRLAFLLADLPVQVLVRLRSDRVMYFPAPPRTPGTRGRGKRHGPELKFQDPQTWPTPAHATTTQTTRYGDAHARSWDRLHPKLTRTGAWTGHTGPLPIMEGTVIRLEVDRLPGTGTPKPLWLWHSTTATTTGQMDRLWQMFLRRFDLEHTFRFLKQTLGWTTPRLRAPEAADRWTWLMIAAYTQLRLTRHLVEDLRRPWERRVVAPARLSPARVRRGFRRVRPTTALPATTPKFSQPGPGRPAGSRNSRRAPLHDPGKASKRTSRVKT